MTEKTDHDLLVELHEGWIRFEEHYKSHCASDLEVREAVFGNGKDGVKAVVADHIAREDERIKWFKWLAGLGTGTGVSGLAAALAALFK